MAGLRAKTRGTQFETLIENCARIAGWQPLRIPDGCRQMGKKKMIRVKSPFDFILAKAGQFRTSTLLFDAKHTSENKYYTKSKNDHQIAHLLRFGSIPSYACGYVVNYEKHGCVVFHTVNSIAKARNDGHGLAHTDGVLIGSKYSINFDQIFDAASVVALGER